MIDDEFASMATVQLGHRPQRMTKLEVIWRQICRQASDTANTRACRLQRRYANHYCKDAPRPTIRLVFGDDPNKWEH